jgi:hypothetical protein
LEDAKMTVTEEGKVQFLKALLAGTTIALKIRLAKVWPAVAEKLVTNATVTESTFGGYAAKDTSTFGVPTINGSDEGESDSTTLTWTSAGVSGSENVYGLYITFDVAGPTTYCLAAHKFSSPYTIALDGEVIEKNLNAYLQNLVP